MKLGGDAREGEKAVRGKVNVKKQSNRSPYEAIGRPWWRFCVEDAYVYYFGSRMVL